MKAFRTGFAILVAAVILLAFLAIVSQFFHWGRDANSFAPPWTGMPMGPGMFWGGGMWLFPLIGLAVFLFVVYSVFGRRAGAFGPQIPMDALKMRYAKGEIDREEFERMKKDISGD